MANERAPHALLCPAPGQGHIAPFMQLAHILTNNGIAVSFLNTDYHHKSLVENLSAPTPIRFFAFPQQPLRDLQEFFDTLVQNARPVIHNIILQRNQRETPVSVIISDLWLPFTQEIADHHGIPRVCFRTAGAATFSLWLHMPPIASEDGEEDFWERWRSKMAGKLHSMENLRVNDLPKPAAWGGGMHLATEWPYYCIQIAKEKAALTVFNTWHELEKPLLEDLHKEFSGKVLSIGPLSSMAEGDIEGKDKKTIATGSLWKEEDDECLKWLDRQRERSVLYVSIGSSAALSEEGIRELALGLEGSGYPFLWVIREDMESGFGVREEVKERCGERACFVKWAPQRKVLSHGSVGGFLTHCGWNSVMEGLSSGVPMICMPFFSDQPCNRTFVCHVWRCGLELKDKVESEDVEAAVKRLLDVESADGMELRVNAQKIRQSSTAAVAQGGSSLSDMNQLIDFVKGY